MAIGPDIDAKFDEALRAYLRKHRDRGDGCPDSAIVAAYFEQSLDEHEARELEEHFAQCASCQSELALLASLDDPATGVPASSSPASEAAIAAASRHDERAVRSDLDDAPPAVELRSEQLEPITEPTETAATHAEDEPDEVDELDVDRPSEEPPLFVHVPRRSRWGWVAPTALAATAVIAVSVTYRFARDETSRRALEPRADRRANELAPPELGPKQAPPAGVVEEPRSRVEASNAPPQQLDELAKSEPAPMAGGAVASGATAAEKKDESRLAAKPSADASSAVPAARAKAAAPSTEVFAPSAPEALQDKERDRGEQAAGANGAREEAPSSAVGGAAAGHGVIAVTSPTNRLLAWRFSGAAIERSDDGGETWQPQASPAPAAILAASAPNGEVCWAVGKGGIVIRTLDGRNWQVLKAPTTADLVQASASNESSAIVKSADGHQFSTTDGGATWSER
jgi:hypothetical protein